MRSAWGLAAILLAACGGAPVAGGAAEPGERAQPSAQPSTSGPIVASEGAVNRPATPPVVAAPPAPASPSEEAILTVAPGFRPDPIVRRGRGGGPMPADSIHPDCRGYVTAAPSYVLKVDRAMPSLRLLVSMQGDATLVVQLADGRVMCNDDSEGLNPIVEGAFPAGRHRVFVGTYGARGAGTPYTFAVTSQSAISTRAIESLPSTP